MLEYARHLGFDDESADDFWQIIRLMDTEYCKLALTRAKSAGTAPPPPAQPKVKFGRKRR